MKTSIKTLLAVAVASLFAINANAGVSYGSAAGSLSPYIGVKAGQFNPGIDKAKDATVYGVYGGMNFDQNFGVEGEYASTEDKDYTNAQGIARNYKAKTYGLYGTYRYNFVSTPVYAKAKLGLAKTEVTDKAKIGINTKETDKTSIAGGVGIGVKATDNFGVEATYNYLNGDDKMWGVGAHVNF